MRKISPQNNLVLVSGFTLIEILIYFSIFLVVSTISIAFLLSLNTFVNQYQIETALYRSGTNTLEQIIFELRQADRFDSLNSTLNNQLTGELSLIHGATSTQFTKVGNALELTVNGENYGDLTGDAVIVNGFTVYQYDTVVGEFVRVRLDLQSTIGSSTKNISLYGGSVIRGAL